MCICYIILPFSGIRLLWALQYAAIHFFLCWEYASNIDIVYSCNPGFDSFDCLYVAGFLGWSQYCGYRRVFLSYCKSHHWRMCDNTMCSSSWYIHPQRILLIIFKFTHIQYIHICMCVCDFMYIYDEKLPCIFHQANWNDYQIQTQIIQ